LDLLLQRYLCHEAQGFLWWWEMVLLAVQMAVIAVVGVVIWLIVFEE
jgi:hypothetical protein